MLIRNSADLNIDLNARDLEGRTAFHLACGQEHSELADVIIKSSDRTDRQDFLGNKINNSNSYAYKP